MYFFSHLYLVKDGCFVGLTVDISPMATYVGHVYVYYIYI